MIVFSGRLGGSISYIQINSIFHFLTSTYFPTNHLRFNLIYVDTLKGGFTASPENYFWNKLQLEHICILSLFCQKSCLYIRRVLIRRLFDDVWSFVRKWWKIRGLINYKLKFCRVREVRTSFWITPLIQHLHYVNLFGNWIEVLFWPNITN